MNEKFFNFNKNTGKRSMKPKPKDYLKLARFRWIWVNLFLCLITLGLSFWKKEFLAFFFLATSNLFDMLGYYIVLRRMWGKTVVSGVVVEEGELRSEIILPAYRVIQNMFDYLLLFVVFWFGGWKVALAGAILKWFGLQDVLFYLFLKVKFPTVWTWLEWTPFGLLIKGEKIHNILVIIQAILGLAISIILLFVL